jgi:hypothetical protein
MLSLWARLILLPERLRLNQLGLPRLVFFCRRLQLSLLGHPRLVSDVSELQSSLKALMKKRVASLSIWMKQMQCELGVSVTVCVICINSEEHTDWFIS